MKHCVDIRCKCFNKGPILAAVFLTRGQNCFTISKLAADWHELIIQQHTMRPSTARIMMHYHPNQLHF